VGDAHRHINEQHRDLVASIATKHSRGCCALPEPLWTCEPRWRAAWYRLHQLKKCIVPLYSLLDDVAQRRESWQRMLEIIPFPRVGIINAMLQFQLQQSFPLHSGCDARENAVLASRRSQCRLPVTDQSTDVAKTARYGKHLRYGPRPAAQIRELDEAF
jgi:hypothetical protein